MRVYADTSFILAIYHPDALTHRANTFMTRNKIPLILTAIQDAEFRNTSRLRVPQQRSSSEEIFRVLAHFDRDISEGIFEYQSPDWTDLFRSLERISQKYAEQGAYRFPDLLHIACALNVRAKTFLSFDKKQSELAKALGMQTPL